MTEVRKSDLNEPVPSSKRRMRPTLATIDKGTRVADQGSVVPITENSPRRDVEEQVASTNDAPHSSSTFDFDLVFDSSLIVFAFRFAFIRVHSRLKRFCLL